MKTLRFRWRVGLGFLALFPALLSAKATDMEAAQLGGSLTPLGAIKAGNGNGSIPAWDGGVRAPSGWKQGQYHPDPYPNEQPLYTITAANYQKYEDQLSPGQVAMLKRYPDTWKLNVYPSHRTANYPQFVYKALKENATKAELASDGDGVNNSTCTSPFPIPKDGLEVIWNHLLRYRGKSFKRTHIQVVPTAEGTYEEIVLEEETYLPYNVEGATTSSTDNILSYFLQTIQAPTYLAGNVLLVHEPINQSTTARQAWAYNPGIRRVRRAPNIAYDNPGTASEGQRTTDQFDMFNGSPDRYNWELIGRKEMIIPYNCYKVHAQGIPVSQIVKKGHLNPDLLRYELHRVWEVKATLKSGTNHIYATKVFYVDEDSWQLVVANFYDSRGQIWRVAEAYPIVYYEVPMLWPTIESSYDLRNGRYVALGINNNRGLEDFNVSYTPADFSPSAMRRSTQR